MSNGIIRKLSVRGYGFIKPEVGGSDIFMHASALTDEAVFDELIEGQAVEFDTELTETTGSDKKSRPKAINVRLCKN